MHTRYGKRKITLKNLKNCKHNMKEIYSFFHFKFNWLYTFISSNKAALLYSYSTLIYIAQQHKHYFFLYIDIGKTKKCKKSVQCSANSQPVSVCFQQHKPSFFLSVFDKLSIIEGFIAPSWLVSHSIVFFFW